MHSIFHISLLSSWQLHISLNFGTLILLMLNTFSVVDSIDLRPNCGFPGRPFRSKINPEEKLVYTDGESVTYSCTDYWAPPMERKCVNGTWAGAMARCGDFVRDVLMKDSQLFDMFYSHPLEIFHFTDMQILNTNWKYPNAFTSNRFKNARMRIDDDHLYIWKFNFTKPVPKLYVKMNFSFMNFTLLSEEMQKSFKFSIQVDISPHRTCVLDYQNKNLWRDKGNRIDTYFVCEAHSNEDIIKEAQDPPNYMTMSTKASHNISHEFVALFFGRVYGNESEPLCGEPQIDYGQTYRAVEEFKNYVIDCADENDWVNVAPDRFTKFSYEQKCIGDMIWSGTTLRCVPTWTCSLEGVFESTILEGLKNESKRSVNKIKSIKEVDNKVPIHKSHHMLVIDSISNYYHFIDNDTIYAIPGTELVYSCRTDDYILVGRELRKCTLGRIWTNNEPTCKFIKSTNELVDTTNTFLIIIVVMSILLFVIISVSCVLFVLYTKRLRKRDAQLKAEKACINAWHNATDHEYTAYNDQRYTDEPGEPFYLEIS